MKKTNPPAPDIVYEVFVRSFCDSNGDGIGDLPGLISKLDYIKDLGATAIWLMPVHPSPSYHHYDVIDYYAIHPAYGTMEDMERLIYEAKRRGMKVIMDFVINHTSTAHPWFIASASSPDNPYRKYYVWEDGEAVMDKIEKKEISQDSDNLTQWHEWPGQKDRYYGYFWKGMPDLNFDHSAVKDEMLRIADFWIQKGVDGFRLDAAKHIFPDDEFDKTKQFWEAFTPELKKIDPEILLIGEVWSDPKTLSTLFKGLPALFNFELAKLIPEAIQHHDASRLINTWNYIHELYTASGHPYEDATLLSNHDMTRIRSLLGGDLRKSKLAAAILLSLPGTPYIYYGEEIGMLGEKPDILLREPFLWGDEQQPDTHWQVSHHSTPTSVVPLKQQKVDYQSIFHHYKKWISLRKEFPALASGLPLFQDMQDNELLGYIYKKPGETIWIVHNLSNKEKRLPFKGNADNILTSQKVKMGEELILRSYESGMVMLMKENR